MSLDQSWRTALTRWGDELWALAVLRTGDRGAAQRAMVAAFTQVFAHPDPPSDAHPALIQALLRPRRRWLPSLHRRRALSRPLLRIPPQTRMLLAMWLVYEQDGLRLQTLAGGDHVALVERLARALLPLLPRRDLARRTMEGRAAFTQWLRQRLHLPHDPLPDAASDQIQEGWQQAVARMHDLLAAFAGRQRLPAACRDVIEAALLQTEEDTPTWQRWAGWLAVGVLLLAAVWVLRPAPAPSAATAPAAAVDARVVVQQTLDAWTTVPVSGTLHRRVWARDLHSTRDATTVTDVWLQDDGRYRVETQRGGKLVEWHLVNDSGVLVTAADPQQNMCRSAYGLNVLDRQIRMIPLQADQLRAVRDARLQSGMYGEGYRLLQRALRAPDLRSYGTRVEDERALIMLGFSDRRVTPARTILLLIDPLSHELQTVRELIGDGTQTTARDLWRLEQHEQINIMPTPRPSWSAGQVNIDHLVDPACPGVTDDWFVSLRMLVGVGGWGLYVPNPLPPDVTHAAIINTTPSVSVDFGPSDPQIVLRSADGWLRIKRVQTSQVPTSKADDLIRGAWRVRIEQRTLDQLRVRAWDPPENQADPYAFLSPVLEFETRGWTQDEVLAVIDRLQPITPDLWADLQDAFFDPHPLSADVQHVIQQAQQALTVSQQMEHQAGDGALHIVMDYTMRVDPNRPRRLDPYHVPLDLVMPAQATAEQWTAVSDGETQRSRGIMATADGAVISFQLNDDAWYRQYDASQNMMHQIKQSELAKVEYPVPINQMPGIDMAGALLRWSEPMTMTADGDRWRFEQALPMDESMPLEYLVSFGFWGWYSDTPWMDDLGDGQIMQRIWLDRADLLPQRWEFVHVDAVGRETLLRSATVRTWETLDAPPGDAVFAMPPLPSDAMVIEQERLGSTRIITNPIDLTPPARALVWPESSGIAMHSDRSYATSPQTSLGRSEEDTAWMLMQSSVDHLASVGLAKETIYRMPSDGVVLTITQGRRDLLRRTLRFSSNYYLPSTARESSEPLDVTIAGRQHTAWLLRNDITTALVVEVDDILLHIAGPEAYLRGLLLEQLPALEWVDVTTGATTPEVPIEE